MIDGEVVVCGGDGLTDFNLLRRGQRVMPEAFLYAFDLLALNGQNMRHKPIEARKAALAKLLTSGRGSNGIHFVDHLEFGDAAMVFAHACSPGCEGIVSKRKGSPAMFFVARRNVPDDGLRPFVYVNVLDADQL